MRNERIEMELEVTEAEREALHVLARGMASISNRTELDEANGVRCVQGKIAKQLVGQGYAADVPHWRAVEMTRAGWDALRSASRPVRK